jgi:hypothetical protein
MKDELSGAQIYANLRATYYRATPEQKDIGLHWYDRVREEIRREALRLDVQASTLAIITAVLSPRCPWQFNLPAAVELVAAWKQCREPRLVGPVLPANKVKAWELLCAGACSDVAGLLDRLTGPKVQAFARNLCGYADPVTVDVWMKRAAGYAESTKLTKTRYAVIAFAVQDLACFLRAAPCNVQAIIWTAAREA